MNGSVLVGQNLFVLASRIGWFAQEKKTRNMVISYLMFLIGGNDMELSDCLDGLWEIKPKNKKQELALNKAISIIQHEILKGY